MNGSVSGGGNGSADYDVVVVGGSLAGCTTAMLLGRAGHRVALVEKQPDPKSYKRMCSHFIQASAVPTIERLGLLEPIVEAGGVRSRIHAWTEWGWIEAPAKEAGLCLNLRRELLDPLVREAAADVDGVELLLGHSAERLTRSGGAVSGVTLRDREGTETELRARLVVGADGRDSKLATIGNVAEKTYPHGRFAYGSYFEGPPPEDAPDGRVWMADPQWAAAFPTDHGLTFYAAMPTMDRLPEFKRDPGKALVDFIAGLPEAPPIRESRCVDDVLGKIDMTNRVRRPREPGLALVGDAALATDPLFGVGCGWAFQSGEWLADSVSPALAGSEPLEDGLERYRKLHRRRLGGHTFLIHDYAGGRRLSPPEKLLFSAAARDPKVATWFDQMGTRRVGPARIMAKAMPRAVFVNARHALGRRGPAGEGEPAVSAQIASE